MSFKEWVKTHRLCLDPYKNIVFCPYGLPYMNYLMGYGLNSANKMFEAEKTLFWYKRSFNCMACDTQNWAYGDINVDVFIIRKLRFVRVSINATQVLHHDIILDVSVR